MESVSPRAPGEALLLMWHALIVAALLVAAPEPAPAPTAAEARRILATPRGSLSVGYTSGGRLDEGAEVPLSGRGWTFLSMVRGRGTNFGTAEMKGLLERVGARVRERHPRSVVGVGNISIEGGGKTRWHVSHQAGRDIDLALFGVDARGKPLKPQGFVRYGPDGLSVGTRKRYRFDVERNLTLVTALLEDEVPVQWIFVAEALRAAMLEEAQRQGVSEDTLARMAEVVHQPSDSNPHDNHFHVRIFCSVEDRLHGCLERGPLWPWVDRGDDAYRARIDRLLSVLRRPETKLRSRAATALGDIRARRAIPALLGLLADRAVRAAALDSLQRIADPIALPGLLAALAATDEAPWARRIVNAMYSLRSPDLTQLAVDLAASPTHFLHPDVADQVADATRVLAARALERDGRKPAAEVLLALLESKSGSVRRAAHAALVQITSHTVQGDPGSSGRKTRRRGVDAWTRFWRERGEQPWRQWVRDGIVAAGYDLPEPVDGVPALELLIEATGDKRDHVGRNAVRLLGDLTGHVQDPHGRSARNQRRHFQRWWETEGRDAAESTR